MGIESGTYISDLNSANPTATDPKSEGDDHIRLIKALVKATFPNIAGAVTPSHTQLNTLLSTYLASAGIQDFRLTLTSGSPVGPTSDVTAATTLYCCPYKGSFISLFDGTNWAIYSSAQFSIAVPAVANQMYDVFCYANAGVPTLELAAWTNDTTRATALVYQNGVLVKSGATTRRYIGSFRTTSVAGQTEDSQTKRYVWNMNNRVGRKLFYLSPANIYTVPANSTWQYVGGASFSGAKVVVGLSEDPVCLFSSIYCDSSGANQAFGALTLCVDTGGFGPVASVPDMVCSQFYAAASNNPKSMIASMDTILAPGYHEIEWMEKALSSGLALAVYGNNAPASQDALIGTVVG